jgi:MotA/TolQ/ExbB proton channel family
VEYIFPLITLAIFACAIWRELSIVRERIAEENAFINYLVPKDRDIQFTHPNKKVEKILLKMCTWINDYSKDEQNKFIENTRCEYEDIFRRCKNSLSRPTPRSEVHFIPSVLTSMGLLGTFWGIQGALSHLDTSKILESVDPLLGSMKTAFTSSLCGLGFAAVFIVFLAFSTYAQNIYRKYLRKRLSNLNYTPRSDKDVSTELINAAKKMQSLDSKSIGAEVGNVLTPIFSEILTELKSLREFKADRGQDILKELRDEVIAPISVQLKESAVSTKEASEAVISLRNELGGVSKDLALSIITIQDFQGKTLSQLEIFANNLSNTLVEFQTGTKDVLKEVGEEIKRGVEESIIGMKSQREAFSESANQASQTFTGIQTNLEAVLTTQTASQEKMLQNVGAEIKRGVEESIISMNAQQQAFSDSTTQAADTFRDIRTELELALTKQTVIQEQMLQNVEDRMNTILSNTEQAFEQQSNTLELVGEKASNLMNMAGNNLLGTLGNIDAMLQNTRQTVQDELNNFRETYQESLDKFFKEQNNLLESTLGTQRQGLSDVVIELQIAFQEEADRRKQLTQQLDENLENIQRTVGVVSKLVNTVGLHDGARIAQMQELSQNMGTQVNNLERSYRDLNTRYEESLRIGNEQLSEYFQRAIVHEQKFFEEADSSTAKLCNTLLKAADYLVATEKSRRQEQGDN